MFGIHYHFVAYLMMNPARSQLSVSLNPEDRAKVTLELGDQDEDDDDDNDVRGHDDDHAGQRGHPNSNI